MSEIEKTIAELGVLNARFNKARGLPVDEYSVHEATIIALELRVHAMEMLLAQHLMQMGKDVDNIDFTMIGRVILPAFVTEFGRGLAVVAFEVVEGIHKRHLAISE